jgi:ABC-2 type transport system permease protein
VNPPLGFGSVARLALRRDRIRLAVWTLIAVAIVGASASSIKGLYPTEAARQQYATTVGSSPSSRVLGGPGYGVTTLGGITVNESATLILVLIALFNSMLVVRHTRKEEETGRAELLASTVLGRHARLTAALTIAAGTDLVVGAGIAAVLIVSGLPLAGSLAYGASVAAVGLFFAAVGAVAAQWTEHARWANSSAIAVLGVAFGLRAVGDATTSGGLRNLSWASPLGWAQQIRAYDGERWWVLAMLIGAAVLLAAAAAGLSRRRDVGAGLLQTRLGPAQAGPRLAGPWGLAWRLQRGGLITWAVGMALAGAVFGTIADTAAAAVGRNSEAAKVLARLGGQGAIVDSYLSWFLGTAGVAASVFAVLAITRLRAEESEVHTDPVLATAVTRTRWMGGHVLWAGLGMTALMLITGFSAGLTHGLGEGRVAHDLGQELAGAVVQLPAAAVLAGIGIALFGLAPRLGAVVWVFVVGSLLLGRLGDLLRLDQKVMDVSPFSHVPRLPGGVFTAEPLLWLTGVAVALTVVGFAAFQRRDVIT